MHLIQILFNFLTGTPCDSCRNADSGAVFRNVGEHHGVGGNLDVAADVDGAEHLGTCTNHDVVTQCGVALALVFAGAAQRHALIQQAVVADDGGFADDHAHAVVDEQTFSDLCAGVDLDACLVSGTLGDDACDGEPFVLVEPVGTAVAAHRFQTGVRQQNLQTAPCCRILFLYDCNIFPKLSKHLHHQSFYC